MKHTLILAAGVGILAIGGLGYYQYSTQQSETMMKTNTVQEQTGKMMEKTDATQETTQAMMEEKDAMMEKSDAAMAKAGTYVPFTPQALAAANTGKRVLFFYASWCPTCKPADADFSQNAAQLPDDVTVLRVNYNDPDTDQAEKDLAKKYGVTYQHTYVQIDSQGNEVAKWNGGKLAELVAKIK